MGRPLEERVAIAALHDVQLAAAEYDGARMWFEAALAGPMEPLGAEVWVFDAALTRVVLVHHRVRDWVPPGGMVEPGETPRAAAARELREETGLALTLLERPAAACVRSFQPDGPVTLSLSYVAIASAPPLLVPEDGQPAAWTSLDRDWVSAFPEDRARMRWYLDTQLSPGARVDHDG